MSTEAVQPEENAQDSTNGEEAILSILLHHTDALLPDIRIMHPVVRIHIVDIFSPQYRHIQ